MSMTDKAVDASGIEHHSNAHIFEIPVTTVYFYGTSADSTEIVTGGSDAAEEKHKFFTDFSYTDFATGKPRPLASMLNEVLHEIEAFIKQPMSPHASAIDSDVAKKNYDLMMWYLNKLDSDYKHAAEHFTFFKNHLSFSSSFGAFPIFALYSESNNQLLEVETCANGVFEVPFLDASGKEAIKVYSPDVIKPYWDSNSGKKHLMLPYSHLGKCYRIKSIWQYCLALCEHLSSAYTLDIRLRRCKNCGKFYITPLSVRRSNYCSPACTAKERKAYKQTFTEHQDIANRIMRRLREQSDIKSDQLKKDFQAQNKAFKKAVQKNLHTKDEYLQWLKEQDMNLRLRKPKTPRK